MRVLLIQSYMGGDEPPIFPLGLSCLAPYLKGHEVKVFDPNLSTLPYKELTAIIELFLPDVIGISLRNIDSTNKRNVKFYYHHLARTIEIIKSCSQAKIVVGGPGFSMFAEDIMKREPGIDCGVFGEAEDVLPTLIGNLDQPERVRSVYYRRDSRIYFTGAAPRSDLNRLEAPDRKVVPLAGYKEYKDAIGVETKRGCSLDCIYCVYPFLNGRAYRLKDPVKVVDEIQRLQLEHGVERFMFVDSVFNIPQSHAERICEILVARGINIRWSAWFNEKNLTRKLCELIQRAGCDHVMLSPDGYTDATLKKLGKNLEKREIIEAYRILRDADLEISYNFFKNPPGQNIGNFIGTLVFCLKAKLELGARVHFEFNSLRIEPESRLYSMALKEGTIESGQNLLLPTYYVNKATWWAGQLFDILLKLKGK